jgi:4-amino-4-deoxy-L-arabinose transferase
LIRDLTQSRIHYALLAIVLIGSFLVKLHHLGHLAVKGLDESFHAIVAQNLLEHPFTPTLIDRPYLPYDYRNWQENHVWLHKGVVPLWQIALSYLLFGVNTLALRLPSALLATGGALLTYLIGRELLDRRAALIGAALQAFSPALTNLVHGYIFSDHVDIALVFWVELGIWFTVRAMRTGRLSDAILAGAAQGLAFLTKMYPALIVSVVAAAGWLLPALWPGAREQTRFAARHLAALLLATGAVVAPWLIACAIRFPREFVHEHLSALHHLHRDVESWAAPWDRLIFGYSLAAYFVFYPTVLTAIILVAIRAWTQRSLRIGILYVWGSGVLIPFTLAASKTPSATAIGWGAFFLLIGEMIRRAIAGDALMIGGWLTATTLAVFARGRMNTSGMGGAPGEVFRQNIWVLWHLLAAVAGAILVRLIVPGRPRILRVLYIGAAAGSAWLLGLWITTAWKVTNQNINEPAFVETGEFVRTRLPAEAVLLLEEKQKLERNALMFRARRTTYALDDSTWRDDARTIVANGGVPVIVSHRDWPLKAIFRSTPEGRTIFQLTPDDLEGD